MTENLPASTISAEERLVLYRDFSELSFSAGEKDITLGEENPGLLVMVYWASWCPYCNTALEDLGRVAALCEEKGARLVLANKLDGEKETRETAAAYLLEHGISVENWFDEGAESYEALGLGMIPSLLVFDGENRLMGFKEGELPGDDELASLLNHAAKGNDQVLMEFARERLVGSDGSVAFGEPREVLSESLGLMMLAADAAGDDATYDLVSAYTMRHKTVAGLVSWRGAASVNALVDDLRIYRAMANRGDAGVLAEYAAALYEHNTNEGMPVDFYDASTGEKASQLTLCYADFAAMELLARNDERWGEALENAYRLVEGGRISEAFPLYHSRYDYDAGRYGSETLHMAEAMLTLLHLSRAGRLPAEALGWLEERMADGYLYAVYDPDGRPNRDGHFESTAVYAILARVGLSEGKPELARRAVTRMEELRVRDAKSAFDGAFGGADGSGVHAFDQLCALLTYQELGRTPA